MTEYASFLPEFDPRHAPVLVREVVDVLAPKDGGIYVDATFGAGGYSRALLRAADCTVWAIDRDPAARATGDALAEEFGGRLTLLTGRFGDMERLLSQVGVDRVDGVALDLGVSSMQLDEAGRGFSFRFDGPLDMRMGQEGRTAADVVNEVGERDLADIIYKFGEERASRRIAKAIAAQRAKTPFTRTRELAELIRSVVAKSKDGIDPATRTFQALRIYVNDELGELERGLKACEALLVPGGRVAVVSFHSLEDRVVKSFLRDRSGGAPRPSRHMPDPAVGRDQSEPAAVFKIHKRSGVKPKADEVAANPRSRSARLRWAERVRVSSGLSSGLGGVQ